MINKLLGRTEDGVDRPMIDNHLGHRPTPQKRLGLRHRPFTKPPHNPDKAKARRKMAAKSRKINRS